MTDLHDEYLALIQTSFQEDFGDFGDVSVEAVFSDTDYINAILISKADGVLAGIQAFELTFKTFDFSTQVVLHKRDGEEIFKGDIIAEVYGRTKASRVG